MVMLSEVTNTFWGLTLTEGKRYSQTLEGVVHLSMAALEPGSNKGATGPVSVMIEHQNRNFVLCSLIDSQFLQQTLDLNFNEGEEVTFYLKGKGVVHLTGYVVPGEDYDSASDVDFQPASSFVDSDDDDDDDDDDSSEEDEDDSPAGKKRKKHLALKQKKKQKVEIVDDDEDEEDDEVEDDESEMDEDEEDDDEDEDSAKKLKSEQNRKQADKVSKKTKDEKSKLKSVPSDTKEAFSTSTSSESAEKKKKKKKKKNKSKSESNAAQLGSGDNEGASKPTSRLVEGVTIEDLKVGHGPEAKKGSTVHVYYTGKLPNGKVFDSQTSGKPFKFQIGKKSVIRGWEIGLEGMKVGGKRKLVIPPKMGYGSQKVGNDIPANSTLHFDVELKSVN